MAKYKEIAKLHYPSHITGEEYKHRRVTLYIKQASVSEDLKAAYNKALNRLKKDGIQTAQKLANSPGVSTKILGQNNTAKEGELIMAITLPLPNSFSDSQDHGWSEETGILGTIGRELSNATPFADAAAPKDGDNVLTAGAKSILHAFGQTSIDKAIGSAANAAGMRKPLIDPGYFQNYSGSSPRTFNAEWDLVPNSETEALTIIDIVMKLKQFSSPTAAVDGVALLAPFFFELFVSNEYISAMINLDKLVISNISMDYGADGNMQQTADGIPKQMKLSITFKEMVMTTSNKYTSTFRREGA